MNGAVRTRYGCEHFCGYGPASGVPDQSWLSKTRSRLAHNVHEAVFGWVLALIAERGLVEDDRIGVYMEANAAAKTLQPIMIFPDRL